MAQILVTDRHASILREFLSQDSVASVASHLALRDSEDSGGYAYLVSAAFVVAARVNFRPSYSRGDLIRYVADVRKRQSSDARVDPSVAEKVLLYALGGDIREVVDIESRLRAEVVLLNALTDEPKVMSCGIDAIITDAVKMAQGWASRGD